MNPPVPGWERVTSRQPVHIPATDGQGVADTLWVDVPAWKNPKTGQVFLDDEGREKIERIKARHLGLMTPQEIRFLRQRFDLTQKEISELLQIGEKTFTRWESGRERPSRSMNILLCALRDGRLDVNYLRSLRGIPAKESWTAIWRESFCTWESFKSTSREYAASALLESFLSKTSEASPAGGAWQTTLREVLEPASRQRFQLRAPEGPTAKPQPLWPSGKIIALFPRGAEPSSEEAQGS